MDRKKRADELQKEAEHRRRQAIDARNRVDRELQTLDRIDQDLRNQAADEVAMGYIAIANEPRRPWTDDDFHPTILGVCHEIESSHSYLTARMDGDLILINYQRSKEDPRISIFLPPENGYAMFSIHHGGGHGINKYCIASAKNKETAKKNLRRVIDVILRLP